MFPVVLAIGAGISALSSIAGGVSANKRRKKADQMLEDRRRRLDEWYQSEMNRPYLDRADSRAMLKRIRDYNEDELKALNTNAIKSGATDEAKVAATNKLNKNYSQVVAQIAGLGEQHKDQIKQQYQARLDNLDNARYEAELGKISSNVFGTITRMNSKRSTQTPSRAERRMKRRSQPPTSSIRTIRRSSPKSPDWANSTKTR